MLETYRYFDADPPEPGSARLFPDLEDVPGAKPLASLRARKPTPGQIARLRRDLVIYQAVEGGMPLRMVAKVFEMSYEAIRKSHLRISCRKSRV